jgi:hypothetical protein
MKILLTLSIFMISTLSHAFDHSHEAFTKLLKAHVKMSKDQTSSQVDYKNFKKKELKSYLKDLSALKKEDFKKFSRDQKLSFYINLYNGYTIDWILRHYPVSSIKKTTNFFRSPWKQDFIPLFGDKVTLDHIEHELVRGSKTLGNDARIHFAFNCASVGCPALLNEAWTAEKLEKQLDSAAKNFLKDQSRNRVNLSKKRVEISNIFKWYAEDFESKNYDSIKAFLAQYADAISKNAKEKKLIQSGDFSVSYSGYDWDLNDLR